MASSVDSRVVQMQFDNAQFEQGVQQTMSSLEKLNKSTENLQGAEKGVGRLKSALGNFSIGSAISSGISTLGSGFQSLASIGAGAFDAIVNTATTGLKIVGGSVAAVGAAISGIAIKGGITRAMNIEQAKFQLKGLGIAWSDIEEDINHGVKGTAYGLDSAAKAASQFAASGVEVGDSMKAALRGISGVAAMTSSDYDSIANVFTAVSGQGKVMTQQLRMLELRGMNAAASMAEYFTKVNNGSIETTDSVKKSIAEISNGMDVTEADIREMVTKGVINFDVFSHAMDDTFGLHAKKANETFTGAMSNVKAALARVGANFATPSMEALRQVFVKLIPAIDGVNAAMKPLYQIFENGAMGASKAAQGLVEGLIQIREEVDDYGNVAYKFEAFKGPLADAMDIFSHLLSLPDSGKLTEWYNFGGAFKNIADILTSITGSIGASFKEVFPEADSLYTNFVNGALNAVKSFESFTEKLKFSKDTLSGYQGLHQIFTNIFQGIKNIGDAFSFVEPTINAFMQILNRTFPNVGQNVIDILVSISEGFANFTVEMKPGPEVVTTLWKAFQTLINVGKVLWAVFQNAILPAAQLLGTIFVEAAKSAGSAIQSIVDFLFQLTGGTNGPNLEGFLTTLEGLKTGILEFADAFKGAGSFDNPIQGIADWLYDAADGIGRFGAALKENLGVFQPFFDKIKEFVGKVVEPLKHLTWTDIFAGLSTAGLFGFLAGFDKIFGALAKQLGNFTKFFGGEGPDIFDLNRILGLDAVNDMLWQTQRALNGFTINLQAGALIKIAGAIAILALSLMALSTLDWASLSVGSAGLIVLGTALMSMMAVLSALDFSNLKAGQMGTMGVMMFMIAGAMGLLVGAIKKMGEMNPDELATGLISVGIALGVLTGYAVLLSKFAAKSMAGAMALGSLAQALILLLIPVAAFGHMDSNALTQGVVGVTALLGVLSLAAVILSKGVGAKILAIGPALMAVATAMNILVIAVAAFGYMNGDNLAQGLLALGGALAILALGCLAMQQAVGGALALAIVAAVMPLLAGSIALLSAIPVAALFAGLLGLAAAIAVFAVAGIAVTPLIPVMMALGGALALIGLSVALAGAGILALAVALTTLAASGALAAGSIVTVLTALGEGLAMAIAGVVEGIINAIGQIIQSIIDNAGQIATAVATLISALIQAAITLVPQIVQLGVTIILSLIQGIVTVFPEIIAAGITMIIMFIQGIAASISTVIQAGFELAISFINGVADAIGSESNQAQLLSAVENLGGAILDALGNFITKGLPDIGSKLIDGLGNLIFGGEEEIKPKAESLGNTVTDSIGSSMDNLPTTTSTAVDNTVNNFDGLISGLQDKAGSASSMATEAFDLSGLSEEAQTESASITEAFDISGIASNVEGLSSGITESFDLSSLTETTDTTLSDVAGKFSSNTTIESNAKTLGTKTATGFDSGASTMKTKASSRATEAVNSVSSKAGSGNSAGYSVGSQMGAGMYSGMGSWMGSIEQRARDMISNAKSAANAEAQIKSPSRVFARIGMYLDLGLVAGMEAYQHRVEEAGRDLSRSAINSAMLRTGLLADALDGIDYNPVIRPVLDASQFKADVAGMNGYFMRNGVLSAGYAAARTGAGYLGGDTTTTNSSNVINITLDYKAGDDANQIVRNLGAALKARNILEA